VNAPTTWTSRPARKWAEVYPILDGRSDVDQGTADALTAYCSAWSQWLAAEAQVKTLGLVIKSAAGSPWKIPIWPWARKAQTALRQWGGRVAD